MNEFYMKHVFTVVKDGNIYNGVSGVRLALEFIGNEKFTENRNILLNMEEKECIIIGDVVIFKVKKEYI